MGQREAILDRGILEERWGFDVVVHSLHRISYVTFIVLNFLLLDLS